MVKHYLCKCAERLKELKKTRLNKTHIVILVLLILVLFLSTTVSCSIEGSIYNQQESEVTIDDLNITYPMPDEKYVLPMRKYSLNGEKYVTIEYLKQMITPEDIKKVREGEYTVGVCMHENYTQWSHVLNKGLSDTLEKFNIKVLAISNGNMDIDKMIADIKSLSALDPNVMVVYTLSIDELAESVKEVVAKGIDVEFYNFPVEGLEYPKDHGATITPNEYQMGYYSADTLAKKIGGKGKIARLLYIVSEKVVSERDIGCNDALKQYPDIQIVDVQPFIDNEDAAAKTEQILNEYPDINGIWAGWDQPAMAAASVIENMGKHIYVTGPDIGQESAFSMASDGLFVGSASQQPYVQGVAQALNIVVRLAGKTPPQYIQTPVLKVNKENMSEVWQVIFHESLDQDILNMMN